MSENKISSLIKGPRPLSLHFANSQAIWGGASKAGAAALETDIWHEDIADKIISLQKKMAEFDPALLQDEIEKQATCRKQEFLTGINQYLSYPAEMRKCEAPIVHEIGCVKLHDFGGYGQPILLAPSLVNPFYILDLMPERSLAIYLKQRGYRPFLINWDEPGEEEWYFGIDDYILNRFVPMLEYVASVAKKPVPLIGYCMGGTLSVAVASLVKDLVSKLILLAAPWNFDTNTPHPGKRNAPQMLRVLGTMADGATVGVDILQTFFASVDPTLNDRKFRKYASDKYTRADADFFSAMEVWANNGGPLAKKVGQDCLSDWYVNNLTYKNKWSVGRTEIKPEHIQCPVFVAAPNGDRLVPQDSAFAIIENLRHATKHVPPSGHIGMVVGNRAEKGLWEPLIDWLEE